VQIALWTALPIWAADEAALASSGESMSSASAVADPALEQACPRVTEAMKAVATPLRQRQPGIAHVTRPALQSEFIGMAARDQAARKKWDPADSEPIDVESIDHDNVLLLKHILTQDGFPTARLVGYNGVASVWLVLQHSDSDLGLQRYWLPTITSRARAGELSYQELALFTDRVLLGSGKKQRYGSQTTVENGRFVVLPLERPSKLDQRRKSMHMIPESDYLCVLRFYTLPHP
jgi:hypothetical protein